MLHNAKENQRFR